MPSVPATFTALPRFKLQKGRSLPPGICPVPPSDVGDRSVIDGFFVNGAARAVALGAALLRHIQSGFVYHYAFTMIVGLFALLSWWTIYKN